MIEVRGRPYRYSMKEHLRKTFKPKGTVSAKALRQEQAQHAVGLARRLVWLEQFKRGTECWESDQRERMESDHR